MKENKIRTLKDNVPDAIAPNIPGAMFRYACDAGRTMQFISNPIEDITGYPAPEFVNNIAHANRSFDSIIHPDDKEMVETTIHDALAKNRPYNIAYRILHRDGSIRWVNENGQGVTDNNGQLSYIDGVIVDITGQRLFQEKLRESEERLKEAEGLLAMERRRLSYILEGTNAGTWEWNIETGELILNERWAEFIGYTLEELAPVSIDTWRKFIHPDDLIVTDDLLTKHFKKELVFYEHEMRLRHKNGSWIWAFDRGKVGAWGNDGKPLIMSGTHQDITARKQAEEKIQHMANHDGLTDLPSLRLSRDRLSMAMSLARRNKTMVAVMFVDLDGFKAVNDTFGHDAGDDVLKEVAERLRSNVRETDTVARIGGDEFLLVITELKSTKKAAGIAEKVIRIMSQPVFYKCAMATVGASIGIAIFPRDGADVDRLIKMADEAMYKVKASGKSGYKYANTKLGPRRPLWPPIEGKC